MSRFTWGYMRGDCRLPARGEQRELQGSLGTLMRFQALCGPYSGENIF